MKTINTSEKLLKLALELAKAVNLDKSKINFEIHPLGNALPCVLIDRVLVYKMNPTSVFPDVGWAADLILMDGGRLGKYYGTSMSTALIKAINRATKPKLFEILSLWENGLDHDSEIERELDWQERTQFEPGAQ